MPDEVFNCELCNNVSPIGEMEESGFLLIGTIKRGRPICQQCAEKNKLGKYWVLLAWVSFALPIVLLITLYVLSYFDIHINFLKMKIPSANERKL